MLLDYGQPLGSVMQYAFVVEDIEEAILHYVDALGIGPWFVIGPFVPPEGSYRGKPTSLEISLAMAFSGHTMIELIQQHNDEPSVYRETIERTGYGFHHFAVVSNSFDKDIARYRKRGLKVAFTDRILGSRIAYLDTTSFLPGMMEVVEWGEAIERAQTGVYAASINWDGSEPIRRLPPPGPPAE